MWKDIKTAPRDRLVYIRCDDGSKKQPMKFTPPHWWDAPDGQLRIADGVLYHGDDMLKAVNWMPYDRPS